MTKPTAKARPNGETAHEAHCIANADHWIATRGRRAAIRTKEPFKTREAAIAHAETFGDGRTMIYAVTADGASAHIQNA